MLKIMTLICACSHLFLTTMKHMKQENNSGKWTEPILVLFSHPSSDENEKYVAVKKANEGSWSGLILADECLLSTFNLHLFN